MLYASSANQFTLLFSLNVVKGELGTSENSFSLQYLDNRILLLWELNTLFQLEAKYNLSKLYNLSVLPISCSASCTLKHDFYSIPSHTFRKPQLDPDTTAFTLGQFPVVHTLPLGIQRVHMGGILCGIPSFLPFVPLTSESLLTAFTGGRGEMIVDTLV